MMFENARRSKAKAAEPKANVKAPARPLPDIASLSGPVWECVAVLDEGVIPRSKVEQGFGSTVMAEACKFRRLVQAAQGV
jgi:hypothetical protein